MPAAGMRAQAPRSSAEEVRGSMAAIAACWKATMPARSVRRAGRISGLSCMASMSWNGAPGGGRETDHRGPAFLLDVAALPVRFQSCPIARGAD